MTSDQFSVYFLKGGDPEPLTEAQQLQIHQLISEDRYGESHLVYNPSELSRKLRMWKNCLGHVRPYYAMKANHYEELVNDLAREGVGIDVGSKYEMALCKNELGICSTNMIYSNTIKCQNDLMCADKMGVRLTVADTLPELKKIKKFAPHVGVLWRICLKGTGEDQTLVNFFSKFGDDIEAEEQIEKRMAEIAQLGISLKGIHFNTCPKKLGCVSFSEAIQRARRWMEIGRKHGHQMTIMDVGGGFPAGQLTDQIIDSLRDVNHDPLGYEIIAEPGRFFCSRSFYLLMRIIGKKVQGNRVYYYLNESIYQSLRESEAEGLSLENSSHQFYSKLSPELKFCEAGEHQPATFYGMTCSRNDIITHNISAPRDMEIGDWLCVGGVGAYASCFHSNYNGMKDSHKVVCLSRAPSSSTSLGHSKTL